MNIIARYSVFRVNPFVPVGNKGKPPLYALIPVRQYKLMKQALRKKCPELPENGGIVECTILDADNDMVFATGMAYCSLSDKFDDRLGINLALKRAVKMAKKKFVITKDLVFSAMDALGK